MLGTKLGSSPRAGLALNCQASFPALVVGWLVGYSMQTYTLVAHVGQELTTYSNFLASACWVLYFFLGILEHSTEPSEQPPSSFSGLLPPLVPSGRVECQSTSWKWEEDTEDPGLPSCSTLTSSGAPRLPCKQDDPLWDHEGITHAGSVLRKGQV